jgi:hypothetical protein
VVSFWKKLIELLKKSRFAVRFSYQWTRDFLQSRNNNAEYGDGEE